MSTNNVEKTFCTTREAATLLGVSVGTVQLWVESGLLQAWKTAGGHRRVLRDSVESLLRKEPQARITAESAAAPVPAAPRRLRVLVVEDDATLLSLYQVKLSRWPMRPDVRTSADGFAALLRMSECWPDLLITDLHMPEVDGYQLAKQIRAQEKGSKEKAHFPVIVLTGLDASAIEMGGGVPPGVEVLPKPISFDRLLAIATGIVQQSDFQAAAS